MAATKAKPPVKSKQSAKKPARPVKRTSPGSLSIVSPPEAAPRGARLHVWHVVPGLSTGIASSAGDNLAITVSAEMYQQGGSVWFRALVDGVPAEPSDVVFKTGAVKFDGVRSFTFVKRGVTAGQHLLEIQWMTGTPAHVRDRTLAVYSGSPSVGRDRLAVAVAPSRPDIEKRDAAYADIPDMSAVINISVEATLAIVFSAEASAATGRLMVRALVDGVEAGEVVFCEGGDPERGGARSFTFVLPAFFAGTRHVKLQWKSTGGPCRLGDRTLTVSSIDQTSQRVVARQSQTPKEIKPGGWVTLPFVTSFNVADPLASLAITFSGEVQSNRGRIFLRAVVNGSPASPTDVTLIEGGSKWRVASHTFIVKNVRGVQGVAFQAMVDPATTGQIRRASLRALWKKRSGSDFVQPYLGMAPLVRTYRLLVVGFDPLRPGHPAPAFSLVKAHFEGGGPLEPPVIGLSAARATSVLEPGSNLRDWLAENSGGVARIGQVRYVGCLDAGWYTPPPEKQGNWYWDNEAFEQMWKDALTAADPEVDFHSYDTDRNHHLDTDDLLVAIVRPQSDPYGTLRSTITTLDGDPKPLSMPILDLYLSHNPERLRWGVGLAAHELCHLIGGAIDMYGVCGQISAGFYNVMDNHSKATHLGPFEKMKNGMVQPIAVNLTGLSTTTLTLPSVERHCRILLLHDSDRVAREYFIIENRFPGTPPLTNYDGPLETGAVVVWQIFEDRNIVNWSDVCQGDPRFIRRRAVLTDPQQSFDLAWGDGSPAGFRISASKPNAEQAEVRIQKIEPVLPPTADTSTTVVKARKTAKARLKRASR